MPVGKRVARTDARWVEENVWFEEWRENFISKKKGERIPNMGHEPTPATNCRMRCSYRWSPYGSVPFCILKMHTHMKTPLERDAVMHHFSEKNNLSLKAATTYESGMTNHHLHAGRSERRE